MSKAAGLNGGRFDGSRAVVPVLFLTPLIAAAVPRLTWLLFFLVAIALIVPFLRRGGDRRQLIQPRIELIAVLLVALYALVSVIWAADPGAAFAEASLLSAVAVAAVAAGTALTALDERELHRAALAFTLGAFLGALCSSGRVAYPWRGHPDDHEHHHLAAAEASEARGDLTGSGAVISQGQVKKINSSLFNRAVAMVMFSLWPALLILRVVERGTRRFVCMGLLFLAVAVTVTISQHDSSQVALIVSLLAFPAAWLWRRATMRALAVLWCAAFVVVLPLDFLAYKADLHLATWIPSSFRARIIIWEYTAERVLDHPWLGIGAASTRSLKEPRALAERPEGFVFPRSTGQHAHDLFLQAWYELGVVGVILIAFAGATAALRISLLPYEAQPFAVATFVTFFAVAAFAWGMWQEWLMCAVGLLAIYSRLAASVAGTENVRSPQDWLARDPNCRSTKDGPVPPSLGQDGDAFWLLMK